MVGTPEEVLARRKAEKDDEGLNPFDRNLLDGSFGKTARLDLPFLDVYKMRQAASLLRRLADSIDFISRRTDLKPRQVQFLLRDEAKTIAREMRDLPGSGGRPRKVYDADGNNI